MSGIPAWAVRGAEVECVDGAEHYKHPGSDYDTPLPVLGERYRVAGTRRDQWGAPRVLIVGLPNGRARDSGWGVTRFRPLVPRKTEAEDVALIKAHLRTPKVSTTKRERADASRPVATSSGAGDA